jgi:hypothetical protein
MIEDKIISFFPKNPGTNYKNLHKEWLGEMKLCSVEHVKNIVMLTPGGAKSKPSSGRRGANKEQMLHSF